ncbi:tetratricopeptide repeat protein [Chitinophagaceae bacterium 26-R-25]|nr:tetratricopeptide repeat protein [Chitinophagaceae bacterium 26-R-25]
MEDITTSQLLREGSSLHLAGNFNEAENKYRQVLEKNEDSAVTHNNLGFLLAQQNQLQQSVNEYLRAIEIDPGYSTAYSNLGQAYMVMHRWDDAIEALLNAISLNNDDIHANEGLAKLYMIKANMDGAEIFYRKTYSLNPQTKILLDLAYCLLLQQKWTEVRELLMYVPTSEQNSSQFYNLTGLIQFAANNFGEAIYYFRQALGLEPENITIRSSLAVCFLKTGDDRLALSEFNRIVILDPDNIDALNNLAVLELASNEIESSLKHLEETLMKDSKNVKAQYYKAIIYLRHGKNDEAYDLLKVAASSENTDYANEASRLLAPPLEKT